MSLAQRRHRARVWPGGVTALQRCHHPSRVLGFRGRGAHREVGEEGGSLGERVASDWGDDAGSGLKDNPLPGIWIVRLAREQRVTLGRSVSLGRRKHNGDHSLGTLGGRKNRRARPRQAWGGQGRALREPRDSWGSGQSTCHW